MTQEEARKFLMNKKVFVKNKGKEVQEKLFNLGFKWIISNDKEVRKDVYFLFLFKDLRLAYTDKIKYFSEHKFTEISAEDILSIEIERNSQPKTLEEFCENNPLNTGEVVISMCDSIVQLTPGRTRVPDGDKCVLPNRSVAKAYLALMQLHQLRDCYRGNTLSMYWYSIIRKGESDLVVVQDNNRFLSFPTKELAKEFLSNFKDLIEEAGDLI